jgi:hypothetical protein
MCDCGKAGASHRCMPSPVNARVDSIPNFRKIIYKATKVVADWIVASENNLHLIMNKNSRAHTQTPRANRSAIDHGVSLDWPLPPSLAVSNRATSRKIHHTFLPKP